MPFRDSQFIHKCELNHLKEPEPKNKLLHLLQKIYTVNENLSITHEYLKSKALIREEKERHLKFYPKTIHPCSSLSLGWDTFMILVLSIIFIRLPLMFFDYLPHSQSSTDGIKELFAINILCLFDIIFRLFQGIIHDDGSLSYIELDFTRRLLIYIKGTLLFDIISTIPFLIIQFFIEPNMNDLWQTTFRLMSILKLFRLNDFRNYLQRFMDFCCIDDNYIDLVLLFTTSLIVFHQFTGLQLLPGILETKYFNGSKEKSFWYEYEDFSDKDVGSQFIICMYRVMSTLFGAGFLKYEPRNIYDKTFISFMCIFGCISRCVLLGKILEKFQCIQSHRIKYEETMNQMHQFVRHKKLPSHIHDKFKKIYDFHFRGSYFREDKFEACVSKQLKQDILLHNTRALTEQVKFFSKISPSLYQSIVSKLTREIVLEDEIIFECGNVGNTLYFIASGSVAIFSPSGIEIGHLTEGQFFGAVTLVMDNQLNVSTIVALETCELYRLDRQDFDQFILPNTSLFQEIEANAIEWYDKIRLAEQELRRRMGDGFEIHSSVYDLHYDVLTRSQTEKRRRSTISR